MELSVKFCVILFLIVEVVYSSVFIAEPNNIALSEAFFIPIKRDWFDGFFAADDVVEFSASLLDMPDLPNWMFCRHPNSSGNAFLYGAAQETGTLHIEIIALNRNNYETAQRIMKLNVESRMDVASYEVEMKFLNLNVEDMFRADRLNRLTDVFRNILWKESEVIYVTKVVSSLDVGGRLPLNPNEKEGVVVRIGGSAEFSRTLQDLEREVQPLRNRFPCPRDYKRTSVEHLFRKRNFIADWCSFRLISSIKGRAPGSSRELSNPTYSTSLLSNDDFKPQSINLPRRDFLFDFVISIIVPSAIVGVLSTALTCVMCCNKDGLEKKLDKDTNVQLNQYNSVHHSTDQNGTAERDSIQCSAYTGGSSAPHSTAGSPNSTLHKGYATRCSNRTGTLRGTMLPPPPPYTSSSIGSKRSIAAASTAN